MTFFLPARPITRFTEVVYSRAGHYKNRSWLAFGEEQAAQTALHLDRLGLRYLSHEFEDQPLFNFDVTDKRMGLMHVEALTAREVGVFVNQDRVRFVSDPAMGELRPEQVKGFLDGTSDCKRISAIGWEISISQVYHPRARCETPKNLPPSGPRILARFRRPPRRGRST